MPYNNNKIKRLKKEVLSHCNGPYLVQYICETEFGFNSSTTLSINTSYHCSLKIDPSFPFHYKRKLYFSVASALSELINTLSVPPLPHLLQTRMKEQLSSAGSRMRKPSGALRLRSAISGSSSSPSTLLKPERSMSSLARS